MARNDSLALRLVEDELARLRQKSAPASPAVDLRRLEASIKEEAIKHRQLEVLGHLALRVCSGSMSPTNSGSLTDADQNAEGNAQLLRILHSELFDSQHMASFSPALHCTSTTDIEDESVLSSILPCDRGVLPANDATQVENQTKQDERLHELEAQVKEVLRENAILGNELAEALAEARAQIQAFEDELVTLRIADKERNECLIRERENLLLVKQQVAKETQESLQQHYDEREDNVQKRFKMEKNQLQLELARVREGQETANKRRIERLMGQVVARITHRSEYSTFSCWLDGARTRVHRRRLCIRAVARLRQRKLASALSTWTEQVQRSKKQYKIVKRVLHRLLHRKLASALSTWAQQVQRSKKQYAIVKRVLQRLLCRKLAAGFQTWSSCAQRLKRLRHTANRCLQHLLCSSLAAAWQTWSTTVLALKEQRAQQELKDQISHEQRRLHELEDKTSRDQRELHKLKDQNVSQELVRQQLQDQLAQKTEFERLEANRLRERNVQLETELASIRKMLEWRSSQQYKSLVHDALGSKPIGWNEGRRKKCNKELSLSGSSSPWSVIQGESDALDEGTLRFVVTHSPSKTGIKNRSGLMTVNRVSPTKTTRPLTAEARSRRKGKDTAGTHSPNTSTFKGDYLRERIGALDDTFALSLDTSFSNNSPAWN